jgi:hypothetical protein
VGIFGAWSLYNCFTTLAAMKKEANAPDPGPEEEKKPGPDM